MEEMDAFGWLVALTLRSTVVLSVALGLGLLLRRSSAVARHRLLTLTAVGLLALPVLSWVLPSLELPLVFSGLGQPRSTAVAAWATPAETTTLLEEHGGPLPGPAGAHAAAPDTAPRPAQFDYVAACAVAAVAAWSIGVAAALAGLGLALRRERRLLAASHPLDGPWRATLDEARRTLALARPVRLLTSDAIETPLTCGWPRPAVFLPPIAERWSEDRRRLVVQHELVHVVRGDGLRRLAWRLVAALYWFHPLARIAERQAVLVGEHACDETVVRLGTRPSLYARHLLDIAGALCGQPAPFASALPMVERSQLERRLVMILDTNPTLSRGRVLAIACTAFLAATVVSVACAAQARSKRATDPATVSSSQESVTFDGFSGTTVDGDYTSLQRDFGDGRRISARIHGPVLFDERTGAIRELPRGSSVLIETRELQKNSQRMLITEEQGAPRYEWWRNGTARPVDDDARAWLEEALAAVAGFRAIGDIHGQVGSLQGEIGSIHGQIGSLQGHIGSIQGEEGSLQGKIGAIQGERGSLQGEIGSHQGAIGGLQAARGVASDDLRKQLDREIKAHEAAISKLEAEKDDGALARRLAEAEAELRAFQQSSRGKIAELERQIAAIQSENKIEALEKEIDGLHAEERIDEIERRLAPRLERLKALIDELGS